MSLNNDNNNNNNNNSHSPHYHTETSISNNSILKPPPFELFIIPSKTTKDVDWTIQLKPYIIELGEDPANLTSEMNAFNRMRQDMRGAPGTSIGVSLVASYYRQLDSLSKRLPFGEIAPSLPFQWYDAFDSDCNIRQTSVAFEKANVLFNLAATLCQAARQEDTAKNFQLAASTLTFLKDNFLHPPLLDIKEPCLNFLIAAMLAQAQEMVVLRALKEDKSIATVARLAASAARYAIDARRLLSVPELADLRSCLYEGQADDTDAISLIQIKAATWETLAQYFRAEAIYREEVVGEAIARLKLASSLVETSCSTIQYEGSSRISNFLSDLGAHIKRRIPALEKENHLIYSQRVPDVESLAESPSASLVKIMPWSDVLMAFPERPDLFRRLLPLQVHEEISKYSEEKSKLLRYETLKVTTADTELQTTLTSLGFPAALDALMEGRNSAMMAILPEEFVLLREKAKDLGIDKIEADMGRALDKLRIALGKISEDLDGEIAAHQKGRVEFGADRWTQAPSHEVNCRLFEQLNTQQQTLRQLMNSYRAIPSINVENEANFALLMGPEVGLRNLLPQPDNWLDESRQAYANQVKSQLEELERLAKDRNHYLIELKDALLADDISDALAITRSNDSMALFHKELAKFDTHCARIEENVTSHSKCLTEFKSLWQEIQQMGRSRESEQLRRDLIQRLAAALQSYRQRMDRLEALREETHKLEIQLAELARQTFIFTETRSQERDLIKSRLQQEDSQRGQQYLLEKLRKLSMKDPRRQEIQDKLSELSTTNGIRESLNHLPVSDMKSKVQPNTTVNPKVQPNTTNHTLSYPSKPAPEIEGRKNEPKSQKSSTIPSLLD